MTLNHPKPTHFQILHCLSYIFIVGRNFKFGGQVDLNKSQPT